MRWVQREDPSNPRSTIIGHFANAQTYATECLDDGHPDLIAFQARREQARVEAREQSLSKRVPVLEREVADLRTRVDTLEGLVGKLTARL